MSHCDFSFPQSSVNVPRVWKPASLCLNCSYANDDAGFNFCQHCGFQPAPPSVSARASRVSLDLPAIDRRISSLQSVRAAKPYENRSVVCISNWSPFYPVFQPPSLIFLLPLRMSLDFSCGRTLRERLRSTRPAALISALTLNGNVAAPLD